MKPPAGLGQHGKALWNAHVKSLPAGWELDDREQANLRHAARLEDRVAALEDRVKKQGQMVKGSTGQLRLHPAIPEIRQSRLAIKQLLGELQLPDEEKESGNTAASRRAKRAADTRHARLFALADRRAAGGPG